MTEEDAAVDALVHAAVELLKIPIEPAWVPAIRENLAVTLMHARNVQDFALPDDAEPAFVFEV